MIECIFCGDNFEFISQLKVHSATCRIHPAVIRQKVLEGEIDDLKLSGRADCR